MPRTVRQDLSDDWTVTYTLGTDRNGATVITAITVKPTNPNTVATGGITAGMLRRIPMGAHVTVRSYADVRGGGKTYAVARAKSPTYADLHQDARVVAVPRRGKRHDPRFLAWVARTYLDLVASGVADVYGGLQAELREQGLDYRRGGARELINKARSTDLLDTTVQGRAGGKLTPKALRLLERQS